MDLKVFLLSIILFCTPLFSQQTVTGNTVDETGENLGSVLIINMATDQKVYSNSMGQFSVEASPNDELRFVKPGFMRASKKVLTEGFNPFLYIKLYPIPKEIEEVRVVRKPTGELDKDSRAAASRDKGEEVRDAVGLPQPAGKMREKPAEVKQVLLPILLGSLNIQGAYDLISGKARRQKRQYAYDDLQEHIAWIRNRVEDEYFIRAGIPADQISEFIEFSFVAKPYVRTYVKARNLSGVLLRLEEAIPLYLERLQHNQK